MPEQHIDELVGSSFNADNFKNVRDNQSGVWYRDWLSIETIRNTIRMIASIARACAPSSGGRIYHDSTDAANEFSITAVNFLYRGQPVTIAASTGNALSGGDVAHYIYADPTASPAAVTVSTSGWPTTPHVRIATITLSSGAWTYSNLVEFRQDHVYNVLGEPAGGKNDVQDKTADDTLTVAQSRTTFTNSGATGLVTLTLPDAAAGLVYRFRVADTDGLKIAAATGDTIRVGSSVSAAAGNVQSSIVGEMVELEAVSDSEWVAGPYVGAWLVT